jgi:hypothetical protein
MRDYGVVVNDLPTRFGRNPHIVVDGYVIPLQMERALMTFPIRKPIEHELNSCTVVDMTADMPWDPSDLHDEELSPEKYQELCDDIPNLEDICQLNLAWSQSQPHNVQ